LIGVRYLGKRGNERQYHSYRVEVDRPNAQLDWSAFAEAESPEHAADVQRPLETEGGNDGPPL
jgi:hypothetical protein